MAVFAVIVFAVVILLIMTEKVHRAAAALAGAMVLIIGKVMTAKQALGYIDFNTIGVLVGMMIFIATLKESGMFEYISVKAAKKVKGDPWKIMVAFVILTAAVSAVLDNVTTVLLIGPMTIAIAKMLDVDPVPFLITQAIASNIGGTATLIGDPPNIMIGSAAHLSFVDFIQNTGIAVVFILIGMLIMMKFMFKKQIESGEIDTSKVMALDENKSISDRSLMHKGVVILVFVILGFFFHDKLGLESCVIALTAAALILLIGKQDVANAIMGVEWPTILFFMCLFVVVGGLQQTGVITDLAKVVINSTSGHPVVMMLVLLWASAIISSFLDNIPFVATLIPLILTLQKDGMDVTPLWWAISLGACLGGNGTLIGASANVVISDVATKHGYPITFKSFTKVGMPMMLMSMVIATAFMLIKY